MLAHSSSEWQGISHADRTCAFAFPSKSKDKLYCPLINIAVEPHPGASHTMHACSVRPPEWKRRLRFSASRRSHIPKSLPEACVLPTRSCKRRHVSPNEKPVQNRRQKFDEALNGLFHRVYAFSRITCTQKTSKATRWA